MKCQVDAPLRRVALTALLLLGAGPAAWAGQAITFDEATGNSASNQGQNVGWQFDVLTAITVDGLGWFDERGDGLSVSHEVGIWDPSGTLLASIVLPSGTSAPLDGQYRTLAIAPIVLPVGAGYIVGGLNSSSSRDRLASNVTQVVDPRISYVDATFSNFTTTFGRPTNFSVATTGFYGPMFRISSPRVVPEPTTLLGGLLGLAGLAGMAWRRQRRAA
jgi:hypothetical protein